VLTSCPQIDLAVGFDDPTEDERLPDFPKRIQAQGKGSPCGADDFYKPSTWTSSCSVKRLDPSVLVPRIGRI
jgi:hypothetical protein